MWLINRIILVLSIFCAPHSAFSQMDSNWRDYAEWGALENCNAASINSAVICGGIRGIRVQGYNSITLSIAYTRSAGTGWEFYLEECLEGHASTHCTESTDWFRVAVQNVTPTSGVGLYAKPIFHVTSSTDRITYTITLNYRRIRLAGFVATGTPDANDKITVYARVVDVDAL